LLAVEFAPETTLRYRLVSERDITLELKSDDPQMKDKPQKMSEKLELVMAYKPIQVDPFGVTIIEGKCESAKVTRRTFTTASSTPDATEKLAGRTYIIKLSPSGKITDYSGMTEVVREVGNLAFTGGNTGNQKIKDPDMIFDFIAMQWYLWDAVSTIEKPREGVRKGKTWKTDQLIPLPVPLVAARTTSYTFDGVSETQEGRKAVITSSYELTDEALDNWPSPYGREFTMRGMFGFLRNYQFKSIQGSGRQIFNIETGTVEKDVQQYKLILNAGFLMPLGTSVPVLTIDQNMMAELLSGN